MNKEKLEITPKIQWAVICDRRQRTSVHNTYEKAKYKKNELNEEYKGCCKHRIIKVKIELLDS